METKGNDKVVRQSSDHAFNIIVVVFLLDTFCSKDFHTAVSVDWTPV